MEYTKIKTSKDYNIYIINDITKEKLFFDFLKGYYKRVHQMKSLIGIDYEFNNKKIALMQINFWQLNENGYIYILNPSKVNKQLLNYLIDNIICNKKIKKILHGSESLDIPYTFFELLNNDINKISSFMYNFVDTKYLCDFYNADYDLDNKCKIYDLLLNLKVIDKIKYDELMKNDENLGPIYNIHIDVYKLTDELIQYSLYDVIYLIDLYYKFPKDDKYRKIIPQITKWIFLEKHNIRNIIMKRKDDIDKLNNYMMYVDKSNKFKLIDIYNKLIDMNIIIDIIDVYKLMDVNYFKNQIVYLLKYIIYSIILDNHKVYESNNIITDTKLNLNNLIDEFKYYNYVQIIIKQFHDKAIKLINK